MMSIKQEIIKDIIDVQKNFVDSGIITRKQYREHGKYTETDYIKQFGTFQELKRRAGLDLNKDSDKIVRSIARHSETDNLQKINRERKDWGDKYSRKNKARYQLIVGAADLHDTAVDPFWLRVFLDTLERTGPDIITLAGDIFDFPEFSKFYIDPRDWNLIEHIKFTHEKILRPIRKCALTAQIDLIEGNHESIAADSLVLCNGYIWKIAKDITENDLVAQFSLKESKLSFARPTKISHYLAPKYAIVKSSKKHETVTQNHALIVDGIRQKVEDLPDIVSGTSFIYFLSSQDNSINLSEDYIRLLTWVICDGTIVENKKYNINSNKVRIQFKLSKERKIKALRELLDRLNVPYTFKPATISGCNKLQPYYIRIYHAEWTHFILELIGKDKRIPESFIDMNRSQADAFFETLSITDGCRHYNQIAFTTINKRNAELIQLIAVFNGRHCTINDYQRIPGFKNGKTLHTLHIGIQNNLYQKVKIKRIDEPLHVVSITMPEDTLITCEHGKVNFTGNSRLLKHLSLNSMSLKVFLSDWVGLTTEKALRLDEHRINYIAQADLSAWTQSDIKKELAKNFKIYFDCLLVHHETNIGRSYGYPGFSGHNHKHLVYSEYSPMFGAFEWHQIGCGCRRNAIYTDGLRWHNGFILCHVDTKTKKVNFEYVPVTDHACVGGRYYYRDKSEIVITGHK